MGRTITQAFLNHAADQIALGVRMQKMPAWANAWANQQVMAGGLGGLGLAVVMLQGAWLHVGGV